jgi:hypothetical protein
MLKNCLMGMCTIISYGAIPFVALALFAWYKVFSRNIYFVINGSGIAMQSAFGLSKWVYYWPEITTFYFTVKIVYGSRGSVVEIIRLFFKKKQVEM